MNTHYKIRGFALDLANAFGFLFPAEVFMIQAIAQSLPEDGIVVNIGAGVGTGSLAVVEMRPDLRCFTIDICEGGPFGGFQNEVNAFNSYRVSPLPTQILGKSQEVCHKWPEIVGVKGKSIDYLFIDGSHAKDDVEADIAGWLPYVKPGGYVLFHDYESTNWSAVTGVVDEKMTDGWGYVHKVDTIIVFQKEREE